ncbi:glycosyltransferase sugar-binding domain-containing protein [Apiospora aurea]|uniref:Glycosyltransferase sugar-binding domain-containing protein n=1 Tax=Apiospora aurea TaxID=335848 RepID=A0ABR1QUB1_9PEZI
MNILIPSHRRKRLLLPLILNFVLIYYWLPQIYQLGDRVRQTGPWSTQYQLEQKSVPTTDELDCLHGSLPQLKGDEFSPADPIPNRVHFIYGLSNPYNKTGAGRFDFLCYLAVRSAILGLKADKVFLHYTYISEPPSPDPNADPRTNPWIKRLQHDIELVHHTPAELAGLKSRPEAVWQAAHISDILRLKLLQSQGGIYLDMDAFGLQPWTETLLKSPRGVVLGHEGGNRQGLCNAIMAGHANGTFLQRWLDAYDGVDLSREWNYHSVLLPKEMQLEHPAEVCALPPGAFFWPTWTWNHIDWMHTALKPKEAQYWASEVKRNGGGLFADQFAYHAWSQMAWDRYLKHLTPEAVRTKDTRFNIIVRRFIGDDV